MILFAIKYQGKYLALSPDLKNPSVEWVDSPTHERAVRRSDVRIRGLLPLLPSGAMKIMVQDTEKEENFEH